ncbi:hypothetical protein C8J57DRAFT_1246848 [Mycena rebaudengoi]|nr:hypothetical protein C8J57DRAFT_1246848 [Mycena rebaudengoi]
MTIGAGGGGRGCRSMVEGRGLGRDATVERERRKEGEGAEKDRGGGGRQVARGEEDGVGRPGPVCLRRRRVAVATSGNLWSVTGQGEQERKIEIPTQSVRRRKGEEGEEGVREWEVAGGLREIRPRGERACARKPPTRVKWQVSTPRQVAVATRSKSAGGRSWSVARAWKGDRDCREWQKREWDSRFRVQGDTRAFRGDPDTCCARLCARKTMRWRADHKRGEGGDVRTKHDKTAQALYLWKYVIAVFPENDPEDSANSAAVSKTEQKSEKGRGVMAQSR